MTGWKVHCGKGSNLGNFYLHHPDEDGSWGHFTSWEAAMNEANRLARTVKVELPKIEPSGIVEFHSDYEPVRVTSWESFIHLSSDDDSLTFYNRELKPLGEYLLALHYHNERNKQ